MEKRSRFVFATLLLLSLAACGAPDELRSAVALPSAQASEPGRSLYPPLAADAEEDRAYDYH
jgi:hypothetical protein